KARQPQKVLRHGASGNLADGRHDKRKYRLRQARRDGRRDNRGGESGECARLYHKNVGRLRHRRIGKRRQPVSRSETAALHRKNNAHSPAYADTRRSDFFYRYPHRNKDTEGFRNNDGRQNEFYRSAQTFYDKRSRPYTRYERRQHNRARHARRAA